MWTGEIDVLRVVILVLAGLAVTLLPDAFPELAEEVVAALPAVAR